MLDKIFGENKTKALIILVAICVVFGMWLFVGGEDNILPTDPDDITSVAAFAGRSESNWQYSFGTSDNETFIELWNQLDCQKDILHQRNDMYTRQFSELYALRIHYKTSFFGEEERVWISFCNDGVVLLDYSDGNIDLYHANEDAYPEMLAFFEAIEEHCETLSERNRLKELEEAKLLNAEVRPGMKALDE